jgi:hypothetical protein
MMKKSILYFPKTLSLIAIVFLFMQCKKDDPPPTKSEMLQGSWSLTADAYSPAYDVLGNGTTVTDAYPLYAPCLKDDLTIFKTNSEGEFNEGPTKCDAADPQSIQFLWTLKSNDTILNISAAADFTILQLDGTTLKLSSTFVDGGVTYTETYTFIKK